MTNGLYPNGIAPAGADPVQTGYTVRPLRPVALRFEGATRDWSLDTATNYRAVTPVEQGVALSLCVKQGDIKSSLTTGNTLHEIEYLGGAELGADIRDRVVTANPLARYLAEGQAEIVRIDHEEAPSGFKVAVYFRDLTADPNRVLRSDASISR